MITRPIGYELHMILPHDLTRDLLTSSFNLYCLRYEFFFIPSHHRYNFISLISTWPSISTSSFWSRSLTHRMWAKQAMCFNPWLTRKDYLQTNAFPNLVVVDWEEYPYALQGKPLEEESWIKWWGDSWLDAARLDSWDINISFYQAVPAAELHCNVLR